MRLLVRLMRTMVLLVCVVALGGKAAEDDGKMVEGHDSKMDEDWNGKAG